MVSISPARRYQKAITPELLRCMATATSDNVYNNDEDHAADLIIGAYFFAMRSCEFSSVREVGRTVMIRLGGIRFFSQDFHPIPHDHPDLLELAMYVLVLFEDQKNRLKHDSRTQKKTGDPRLCPVLRFGRAVQRVRRFVVGFDEHTPLCSFHKRRRSNKFITQDFCLKFIRKICRTYGGIDRFGFHESEIGNRSIRSGAAMALFLNDHSTDKIMMLGRWKSKAFLDYIRPQVVQWTRLFSRDMISFNNFFELCSTIDTKGRRRETEIQQNRGHFDMPQTMLF